MNNYSMSNNEESVLLANMGSHDGVQQPIAARLWHNEREKRERRSVEGERDRVRAVECAGRRQVKSERVSAYERV